MIGVLNASFGSPYRNQPWYMHLHLDSPSCKGCPPSLSSRKRPDPRSPHLKPRNPQHLKPSWIRFTFLKRRKHQQTWPGLSEKVCAETPQFLGPSNFCFFSAPALQGAPVLLKSTMGCQTSKAAAAPKAPLAVTEAPADSKASTEAPTEEAL